ncbi:sensor histidine kinase [Caulobacter mirabilis]|uniref:sensor histidine kinase PhyK n=1 Tax=Caulobacter mirabilis TaxID=69666 RepID=UPI002482112C|nr:sensor histidine kinase [Caulobacter mirabilis]
MTPLKRFRWGPATTIRVRLGVALALALLPVLLLGAGQSLLAYQRETADRQAVLQSAAQRSAATARARMEAASVLLETLGPGSIGLDCSQRLIDIRRRLPGYANLIRFDRIGRVACAADSVPADPERRNRDWFKALEAGKPMVVTLDPGAPYAAEPSLFAAARTVDPEIGFGALAAVIPLSSLRPELADRSLPNGAQVAIVDRHGAVMSVTDAKAFPKDLEPWIERASARGSFLGYGFDGRFVRRAYSAAPLVGDDLFVILSAPSRGLFSTAWLDPLSGIVFPLIAFVVALAAVWFAAEQGVGRWIVYLQRVAAIYARGRFTVRPLQADRAPPEIRELAETLDHMAATIVARDASLHESLAQKDALMREIHHRVKNNLQVISSLLSMQERALADPAARMAMNDTRQRITALALIYRALYQGADIKHVDLKPFLEELTGQLLAGDLSSHASVRTEVRADRLVIDPDKLAPLALFAVEAVTNAQKHALSERGGTLTVDFKVNGPEAELTIADDGGGRGSPPDPATIKGVGRTLMTAFARQLRGQTTLEANDQGGLTARLVFPTPEAAPGGT